MLRFVSWSPRRALRVTAVVAVLLATLHVPALAARDVLKVHQQQHREHREKLAGTLESIADACEKAGDGQEADRIRKLALPPAPEQLRLEPLPKSVQPEIRNDIPAAEREWRTKLRAAQQDYANKLYLLAQRLVNQGYASYGFQVLREAAGHDPDHKSIRAVLGFVRYENEWMTPFTRDMLKSKFVWHEKFGWLKKDYVERYENGERYYNGKWISASKEAAIRSDFPKGWVVETDHFKLKTNHSLERGVEVAVLLEEFHEFFVEAFAGFFESPSELKARFNQAARVGSPKRYTHEVNYFATKQEYINALQKKIPQIAITNGLYYTDDRCSYFFHDPAEDNTPTLFHEATHQLLYETEKERRPVGNRDNFWVIEGIACYMESYRRTGDRITVGDPKYSRFDVARYRYLHDKYYVPLEKFTAMGLQDFQNDPAIAKNYTQAAGLVHFFMHYDGGRYRDALIEHLTELYSVKRRMLPQPRGLDDLTDTDYDTLDRQYGEYTKALDKSNARAVENAAKGDVAPAEKANDPR